MNEKVRGDENALRPFDSIEKWVYYTLGKKIPTHVQWLWYFQDRIKN